MAGESDYQLSHVLSSQFTKKNILGFAYQLLLKRGHSASPTAGPFADVVSWATDYVDY
jgi:hypothetical protein